MRFALRRIWWATLPYEGWTWGAHDPEPGSVPCPWWAHPLAWVHRGVDRLLGGRAWGPRFTSQTYRVGDPIVKEPWR